MPPSFDFTGIDTKQVDCLLNLLAETDVEECEIEQGDTRISVKRLSRGESPAEAPSTQLAAGPERDTDGQVTVRAGAVGIFYRAEKPASPPRVEEGSRVKAGDILGYIEVMRIPHSVLCTHDGVLESFLIEDGEAVEYGQPIAAITS